MARIKRFSANYFILFTLLLVLVCCTNSVHSVSVKENEPTIVSIDDVVNEPAIVVNDTAIVISSNPEEVVEELTENNIQTEVVIENPSISLEEIYLSQIGVRELSGKNDGPEVEMYLKTVGLGKGNAWCSAFVKWCLIQSNVSNTINAWSPTAENKKHIVYKARSFLEEPRPGDVGTLFYPKIKRIGHTYFYHKRVNSSVYESVEGNTNDAGSREGDGVYKKIRSFNATHSISRWE